MRVPDRPGEVIYHGLHRQAGGSVVLIETVTGELIGELRHIIRHSPTGLSWGYQGSGAADAARSILIDALGPGAARCPDCHGTMTTVVDTGTGGIRAYDRDRDGPREALDRELTGSCWCGDGYARLPYQAFKRAYLAAAGDFRLSRAEVLAWLARQPGWSR